MSKSRSLLLGLAASLLLATPSFAADVKVAGMTFSAPKAFTAEEPSSRMRKAQFSVGKGEAAGEITYFHFGPRSGGVAANVKRWFASFKEGADEINAKQEKAKAGDIPVTFVSANGTFMKGPPLGDKVAMPNYALLGAIVESKQGAIFIKFTGPKATVDANAKAFRKMVTEAK